MEYSLYLNSTATRANNYSFLYPAELLDNSNSSALNHTPLTKNPEQIRITAVSYGLLQYLLPIIILVGTFGNCLSIAVIVRKRMLGKSVYVYLMMLACADTIVLYVSALKTWVRVVFGVEFLHASNGLCKTLIFFFAMALHMSAWLIVFMTSDRFVAVWFPLKAAMFCTTRRAATMTLACFVIMVVYNIQLLWTYHLQTFKSDRGTKFICGPYRWDNFHNYTYNYLKLATYSFIPFVIVLGLNVCIIMKLNRDSPMIRNSKRQSIQNTYGGVYRSTYIGKQAQNETQRRITYMLLSVSFSWFLLTLPFTLYSVFPAAWWMHSTYGAAVAQLVKILCFLLMYVNHSINFFLYCITGKKFRHEVADVLCMRQVCKRSVTRQRSYTHTSRTRIGEISGLSSKEDGLRLQEL